MKGRSPRPSSLIGVRIAAFERGRAECRHHRQRGGSKPANPFQSQLERAMYLAGWEAERKARLVLEQTDLFAEQRGYADRYREAQRARKRGVA